MDDRKVPGIRRLVRGSSTQGRNLLNADDYPGVVDRYDKFVSRLHDTDEAVHVVAQAFSDRGLIRDWEAIRGDFIQLRRLVGWLDGTGEAGPELMADVEAGLCTPRRVTLVFDALEGAEASIHRLADLLPIAADSLNDGDDFDEARRRVVKNRKYTLQALRKDMRTAVRRNVSGIDRAAVHAVEAAMVDVLGDDFLVSIRAVLEGVGMTGRVPRVYERSFILPSYPTFDPGFVDLWPYVSRET